MLSNLNVYLSIAESALQEAHLLETDGRRPKPNGEAGIILTVDPRQQSFKQSLIAIVFSGIYFEAQTRKGDRLLFLLAPGASSSTECG